MNKKVGLRKERLEDAIRNEISRYFRSDLSNPKLQFVSITKVTLSNDFAYGKVYWDTFDSSAVETIQNAVNSTVKRVRTNLAKVLRLRKVPAINFIYDAQFESEQRITELLNEDVQEKDPHADESSN